MKSITQLPYILDLLEDDSEVVQHQIHKELKSLGSNLWELVNSSGVSLNPSGEYKLQKIYTEIFEDRILESWENLFKTNYDELYILEEGLSIISDSLILQRELPSLTNLISNLKEEIILKEARPNLQYLIRYLFQEFSISGNEKNYYSPLNSSAAWVIVNKKGNPISLCSILILLASRFSLKVEGCNFPGHFMAMSKDKDNGDMLVDCFNGGYIFREKELQKLFSSPKTMPREQAIKKAGSVDILIRVLNNLQHSYAMKQDTAKLDFVDKMLNIINKKI